MPEDNINLFFAHLNRIKRSPNPVLEVSEKVMDTIVPDGAWRSANYFWMEGVKVVLKGKLEEITENESKQSHQLMHHDTSRLVTGK